MSAPAEIPHLTLAERNGLAIVGTPLRKEIPQVLDELTQPNQRLWFDYAGDYLGTPDIDARLLVVKRLPDVITDRRGAYASSNNAAMLLRLLEGVQAQQPPEVLSKVAGWTGLVAVRSTLRHSGESVHVQRGQESWPIKGWPYNNNLLRANVWVNNMLRHDDKGIRRAARSSMTRWTKQIES